MVHKYIKWEYSSWGFLFRHGTPSSLDGGRGTFPIEMEDNWGTPIYGHPRIWLTDAIWIKYYPSKVGCTFSANPSPVHIRNSPHSVLKTLNFPRKHHGFVWGCWIWTGERILSHFSPGNRMVPQVLAGMAGCLFPQSYGNDRFWPIPHTETVDLVLGGAYVIFVFEGKSCSLLQGCWTLRNPHTMWRFPKLGVPHLSCILMDFPL